MQTGTFLQDLAVVMIVAGLVTILFHRLKQPVVLGYIIAGVIIGPHTPPFPLVHDRHTIETFSELGIILLMFSLGLEFSLRKLRTVGVSALIAAILEILLMVWVGYDIGRFFGWSAMDSIFLGAILSISSTTIILKALAGLGKTKEPFAQLIFGILIIEDILGIGMIALLSGIAMTGSLSWADVGGTVARLGMFLTVVLVVGLLVLPRLIAYVASFKSNEMLLVTVLGVCFGVSLLAIQFGYSVALGAFLAGSIIAEAREIHRVEDIVEPVRDMFSAVFFVAIGLLIDPRMLVRYWVPILVITVAVVVGKVITCGFGAFVGGNDTRTALRVGMGLAQIGEFSFVIAALGATLKVTSDFLYPIAVAVSALTTLLTPYLIKSSDVVVAWFDRVAPRPLVNSLDIYTRWFGQIGARRHQSLARKLIWKWSRQMALNVVLVAAVFVSAGFVASRKPAWTQGLGWGEDGLKSALWLAAAVVSLPMLIATFRKLQALGLLLAETRVSQRAAEENTAAVRAIVAQVVPISGTVALALFILVLSSALLPDWRLAGILMLIFAAITWVLWRSFVRIYSKAQVALRETLAEQPIGPAEAPAKVGSLLRDGDLEPVTLSAGAAAVGKLIRELELRTRSGATIVAIERNGTSTINPSADEELQAGDQLLLLGTRPQLEAAKAALSEARISEES